MKTWKVSSLDEETIQGEKTILGRKFYEEIRYASSSLPRYNPFSEQPWTAMYFEVSSSPSLQGCVSKVDNVAIYGFVLMHISLIHTQCNLTCLINM